MSSTRSVFETALAHWMSLAVITFLLPAPVFKPSTTVGVVFADRVTDLGDFLNWVKKHLSSRTHLSATMALTLLGKVRIDETCQNMYNEQVRDNRFTVYPNVTFPLRPRVLCLRQAVVTCKIKLFWNNFEIISAFYFTCNHGIRVANDKPEATADSDNASA